MYTIVIQHCWIVKNSAQLQKFSAVLDFMYTLAGHVITLGLSKPSKCRSFIESSRSGHKTRYNTIWIRTPACLYCEETLLEITLLETWGGPMVSVRMMRMKIIGTIVAKLRAARSRCGYADYLPNILKCSGIPGRSLSEKTVR